MRTTSVSMLAAVCLFGAAAPLVAQGDTVASASGAVQEYIRAASDSNLTRMAQLFGTDKGNAIRLKVADLDKRMVVTSAYLAHTRVRTLGEVRGMHANERTVTTEIALGACKVIIPVLAVHSKDDGWLVRNLDLAHVGDVEHAAGLPNRAVLLANARVLDRHLPAGERNQPRAGGRVAVMKGSAP